MKDVANSGNTTSPISALPTRAFRIEDESAVIELWRRCGLVVPHNNPHKDIARKMRVRPDLFRIGEFDGRIVATVMIGYEGHRGWINYLAVDPDHRNRAFGRQMMDEAERLLRTEGCPKNNLQVRRTTTDVLAFYKAIGYFEDAAVSLGKRLERDN
jgi:ribosomal protein S18 acetylase RimI-like enzyme